MSFTLTEAAAELYKQEMQLKAGDYVRFYVRYGGTNGPGNGFSLGISVIKPVMIGEQVERDGITFFIERDELWFLQDTDLTIQRNDTTEEIEFVYESNSRNEEQVSGNP